MGDINRVVRLGTRGSLLARAQSQLVANQLMRLHPGLRVELVTIVSTGDRLPDQPLRDIGGKGLFTKELEQALLDKTIDFAVHSFKDVPVTMPLVEQSQLVIAAVPPREDPRDVLVSLHARTIDELRDGARVGTSSLRRRCQLLAINAKLLVEPLRGNVDTRLRKLREGQYHAIVLAAAGLRRTRLFDPWIMHPLNQMLHAPAQGALALQCRREDTQTGELLAVMNHEPTAQCVEGERAIVAALHGDCHSPIAASAAIDGDEIVLRAAVGARGGELPVITADASAALREWQGAVRQVLERLTAQGVERMLREPG